MMPRLPRGKRRTRPAEVALHDVHVAELVYPRIRKYGTLPVGVEGIVDVRSREDLPSLLGYGGRAPEDVADRQQRIDEFIKRCRLATLQGWRGLVRCGELLLKRTRAPLG